jgi:hypothetical protein
MTDHTNTYPDLVNVEDWLNAKGYTGEAGACHQAMSLIRSQEKRIAELETEVGKYVMRVFALMDLLPDATLCGELQEATARRHEMPARIAELEQMVAVLMRHEARDDTIKVQRDRIAELEAALNVAANHLERVYTSDIWEADYKRYAEAARAALEKKND